MKTTAEKRPDPSSSSSPDYSSSLAAIYPCEALPSLYPPPLCVHPELLLYFASWYPCKGEIYPPVAVEVTCPGSVVHPHAEVLSLHPANKLMPDLTSVGWGAQCLGDTFTW